MQPQEPYGPPTYPPAPQQPAYPPPPPEQNDPSRYDFFMQPQKPQRPSLFPGAGSSFGKRIGFIVGGAVLLMIIISVGLSLIPNNLNSDELTALGQAQNSLLVTCNNALINAKAQDTKNFASSCSISLISEQSELVSYTGKRGLKLTKKVLDRGIKPSTLTALKASTAANTYDETFSREAQSQLAQYMAKIRATFKTAKSTEQKNLLNTEYTTAQLLDKQLKSTVAGEAVK